MAVGFADADLHGEFLMGEDLHSPLHQRKADAAEIHKGRIGPGLGKAEIFRGKGFPLRSYGIGSGNDAVSAVDIAIHNRQGLIGGFIAGADGILVGICHVLPENVQVPNPQTMFVCVQIDPVIPAAVPDGLLLGVIVGAVGGNGRGGSDGVGLLIPASGVPQRLHGKASFRLQFGKAGELILQSCLHGRPAEAVFLSCLGIAEA